MKNLNLMVVIASLIVSCSTPEKEAESIMQQFTTSLNDIGDVTNITAQDLSRKIKTCRDNVNELISSKREEYTKSEERERFDNTISINDNEIYLALREALTEKSLKSLENVKDKKWINSESLSPSSIFTLDESCISFLNLKNKFNYAIKDGDIMFDNDGGTNPLYFAMDGDELVITNGQGQTSRFREPTFEELIQAKWESSIMRAGYILKKDKKGIKYGLGNENITYTVKGKVITVIDKRSYATYRDDYKYLSGDILMYVNLETGVVFGNEFRREKEKGPDYLTFLFDGKIKPDVKTKTSFSTSSSDNNWDSILDSYEEFVDEYIKLLKKAKDGDTSVVSKYTECLEKAESFQSKLENAKADLTTEQVRRLNKINSKLANAALSVL